LKRGVVALGCGSLTMTLLMIPLNLVVTPLFMGQPVQAVIDLLPWIVLFNLIKSFGNSLLTFLLYKRTGRLLERNR
jgi:riboflavin transporter FmnP